MVLLRSPVRSWAAGGGQGKGTHGRSIVLTLYSNGSITGGRLCRFLFGGVCGRVRVGRGANETDETSGTNVQVNLYNAPLVCVVRTPSEIYIARCPSRVASLISFSSYPIVGRVPYKTGRNYPMLHTLPEHCCVGTPRVG